jgi:tetratricopeptide (TPR) repeat protein
MNRMSGQLYIVAVLLGLAGSCAAQGSSWWNASWSCRRELTVESPVVSRFAGDDLALGSFPTAGKLAAGGRDLRIVTADGRVVVHRVLQTGPGDRVRVAFATKAAAKRYYAYFGNARAKPLGKQLKIRRGVLLETWKNPDDDPRTLALARKTLERANVLLGRDLRDRMTLGHNPFGPQEDICRTFTGWALCPTQGRYTFALASRNASFLLVDGELIAEQPGSHGVNPRSYTRAQVQLTAGLHEVKLYHLSSAGAPLSMVAWRIPGGDGLVPMGPGAFAAFARAAPGPMQDFGRDVSVDFLPQHVNEAFADGWYYQRYRFEAMRTGRGRKMSWKWDFGDGQTSDQAQVDHVYLLPGTYAVTLTGRGGAQRHQRSNRIVVSRPWDRVTRREIDEPQRHARIVADYDFSKLPAGANAHAVLLLGRFGKRYADRILAAGAALVNREKVPGRLLAEAVAVYAETLLTADQPSEAVDALQRAAKAADHPSFAAQLLVEAGSLALGRLEDVDKARSLFEAALESPGRVQAEILRRARVGVGDTWRVQGRRERALEAYRKAGPNVPRRHRSRMIYQGNLARHVEAYIKEGKYDQAEETLQQWGRDLPADKIDGYWSWMRARLAMARRDYRRAAREADTLVGVNPVSNHGAKLLMLACDAHRLRGDVEGSRDVLRRLVETFPESPLAAEASTLLKAAQ